MMKVKAYITSTISGTPLIARVAALYAVLAVAVYSCMQLQGLATPPRPITAVEYSAAATDERGNSPPVRLIIERLNVDIPVQPGRYNGLTNEWDLSDDSLHFAKTTSLPRKEPGNTLIYGHNTAVLLEPTKHLQASDVLSVVTENGSKFHYKYLYDEMVAPDDVSVLQVQPNHSQLTLLTCNGWLNEKRRLMYFTLERIET